MRLRTVQATLLAQLERRQVLRAIALRAACPRTHRDSRGGIVSWLLDGLKQAQTEAKRRPELAKRVHDQPSGFFAPMECPPDCKWCSEERKEKR